MFQALSQHSQLCLNSSNHPSIPDDGLVLLPGVWTPVTPEQAEYLRGLGVECREIPKPKPIRAARADQE